MCGCGNTTPLSNLTSKRDQRVKGKPIRYLVGHSARGRLGPSHGQWKGGKIITAEGYIKIRNRDTLGGKYRFEHRIVMEKALGRKLAPHEQVHHINGIKHDNRPENLELWTRSQPAGTRYAEAVKHCPTCTCK